MEWLSEHLSVSILNLPIVSDQVPYGVLRVDGQRSDASNHSQLYIGVLIPLTAWPSFAASDSIVCWAECRTARCRYRIFGNLSAGATTFVA